MGDRLAELRRQRAVISEHLAWLDREINRLNETPVQSSPVPQAGSDQPAVRLDDGVRPMPVPPAPHPGSAPNSVSPLPNEAADAEAARLLDEYRSSEATLKSDVRKGCLLYFFGAFVLLGLGIAVLYFTIGTR